MLKLVPPLKLRRHADSASVVVKFFDFLDSPQGRVKNICCLHWYPPAGGEESPQIIPDNSDNKSSSCKKLNFMIVAKAKI